MSFLLKITDGLMKGAEIALLPGTRVSLGSSDECDIIISDSTVPPVLCELDVSADGVSVISPDGTVAGLPQLVIRDFGVISMAVGPEEGAWEELRREKKAAEKTEDDTESGVPDETNAAGNVTEDTNGAAEEGAAGEQDAPAVQAPGEVSGATRQRRRGFCAVVFLALLLVVGALAFLFLRTPERLAGCRGKVASWFKSFDGNQKSDGGQNAQKADGDSAELHFSALRGLADKFNLNLSENDGRPCLNGNFKSHLERARARAEILEANPWVQLELTDDETLRSSAETLLETFAGSGVTLASAENRVVKLAGKADRMTLDNLLAAFKSDLPSLNAIDVSGVTIPSSHSAPLPSVRVSETTPSVASSASAGPVVVPPKREYPVAGIMLSPYPCVILKNGVRCMTGAQIGNAVIEKIEAGKLTLREGDTAFEWIP